jgi:hypothetical protein
MQKCLEEDTTTLSKLTQGMALPTCSQDTSEWNLEWGIEDTDWLSSAFRKTCLRQVMAACLQGLATLLLTLWRRNVFF